MLANLKIIVYNQAKGCDIIIAEKVAGDRNWRTKITGTMKISRRYMIKSSSGS